MSAHCITYQNLFHHTKKKSQHIVEPIRTCVSTLKKKSENLSEPMSADEKNMPAHCWIYQNLCHHTKKPLWQHTVESVRTCVITLKKKSENLSESMSAYEWAFVWHLNSPCQHGKKPFCEIFKESMLARYKKKIVTRRIHMSTVNNLSPTSKQTKSQHIKKTYVMRLKNPRNTVKKPCQTCKEPVGT